MSEAPMPMYRRKRLRVDGIVDSLGPLDPPDLPPEIIYMILRYVVVPPYSKEDILNNQKALHRFALVRRSWYFCSVHIAFRTVAVTTKTQLHALAAIIDRRKWIGHLIHKFSIWISNYDFDDECAGGFKLNANQPTGPLLASILRTCKDLRDLEIQIVDKENVRLGTFFWADICKALPSLSKMQRFCINADISFASLAECILNWRHLRFLEVHGNLRGSASPCGKDICPVIRRNLNRTYWPALSPNQPNATESSTSASLTTENHSNLPIILLNSMRPPYLTNPSSARHTPRRVVARRHYPTNPPVMSTDINETSTNTSVMQIDTTFNQASYSSDTSDADGQPGSSQPSSNSSPLHASNDRQTLYHPVGNSTIVHPFDITDFESQSVAIPQQAVDHTSLEIVPSHQQRSGSSRHILQSGNSHARDTTPAEVVEYDSFVAQQMFSPSAESSTILQPSTSNLDTVLSHSRIPDTPFPHFSTRVQQSTSTMDIASEELASDNIRFSRSSVESSTTLHHVSNSVEMFTSASQDTVDNEVMDDIVPNDEDENGVDADEGNAMQIDQVQVAEFTETHGTSYNPLTTAPVGLEDFSEPPISLPSSRISSIVLRRTQLNREQLEWMLSGRTESELASLDLGCLPDQAILPREILSQILIKFGPQLKSLRIVESRHLESQHRWLEPVLDACVRLESLDMGTLEGVEPNVFANRLPYLPHLKKLTLHPGKPHGATRAICQALLIPGTFPCLKRLTIHGTVGNRRWVHALQQACRLRNVDLR